MFQDHMGNFTTALKKEHKLRMRYQRAAQLNLDTSIYWDELRELRHEQRQLISPDPSSDPWKAVRNMWDNGSPAWSRS